MNYKLDPDLAVEVTKLGARDMDICMQCGTCSASCPLSTGSDTFPRKIYRYLQLGLRDKLLESPVPWLCYYCGECNKDCPRGAEPAETMMASRRWLTTQYDWTGLAKRFYDSPIWAVGAFLAVVLGVVLLFAFLHGPVVTDRVELNTFAPVHWIHLGDKVMLTVVGLIVLSNGFLMYRGIMRGTKPPLWLYVLEIKSFIINYVTQMRWRKCAEDRRTRWVRHLLLFSGYVTMEMLVILFLTFFQTDVVHPFWHPTRIFGYYATVVLMVISGDMLISRYRKADDLHRYSDFTDWFFLSVLFLTAFTGILVHIFRMAGWPLMTYTIYVIHLGIAVGMICTMLPFGKLSHLFYRPLAIYLTTIKEKATQKSKVDIESLKAEIGETFMACLQCGMCSGVCPWNRASSYSPRLILRQLALDNGTETDVDRAVWTCVTCNACGVQCPRGIDLIEVMKSVRSINGDNGVMPAELRNPLVSLKKNGNPWDGRPEGRMDWADGLDIPSFEAEQEYHLFTCCTTAYDPDAAQAGRALPQLLERAGVSFGTLADREVCCGDQAHKMGADAVFSELSGKNTNLIRDAGVRNILTVSPHCLNAFRHHYPGLNGTVGSEHYTQVLDRLLRERRLKPSRVINRKVTYHDPCYLGRHNGIYDAPRRVLKCIPGLTLVEMPSNRESSLCCGGGGGGAWREYPSTERLGVLRVREGLETGAEVIATACPYCIRMLSDAIRELKVSDKIIVQDLAELLWQSVEAIDEKEMIGRVQKGFDAEVCHV